MISNYLNDMDHFGIAFYLDGVLKRVGLAEFSDALWKTDSGLTYPEIIDLSLWALTGAPADEAREEEQDVQAS